MRFVTPSTVVAAASFAAVATAQTFRRFGTCPTLGCVIPPDQQDFLAGQYFDIRVEVHAPVNGSEATNGEPDEHFTFTIAKVGGEAKDVSAYFELEEPELETWDFSWFEDLYAQDADTPSIINVASKAWRRVALYEPGDYEAILSYNGTNTTAYWHVRDIEQVRKTKNVLMFIGDGMTTNMITAARLIAHKTVNGRYQSLMQLDKFPVLGHQMTHAIDTFLTDSANSATALYTGHKSVVNALGVYGDTSEDPFDDPKIESIAEIFHRVYGGHIGIVSTAFIADATPAALTAHTRDRGEYGAVIDSFIHGIVNYTWTEWNGPDVLFGGGAENFCSPEVGGETYMDQDYYKVFADAGYQVLYNGSSLETASNSERALGIFTQSNMAKWLDRNVYTDNLEGGENSPTCDGTDAVDQPGLREMTLKAIDILETRSKADDDKGWFIMSEAASVDKQMHLLDYDRALGELLELDDTIRASIKHLEELGELGNTLVVVTADHGHGFDVFGSVDTKYLNEKTDPREKRKAVGTYQESGLSQYINTIGDGHQLKYVDSNFPTNWDPRYTLAQGFSANPDHRENYQVHKNSPRKAATNITGFPATDYFVNDEDAQSGFIVNGTLPTNADQGVHSLTDVAVFTMGPKGCQELFGGVYNSIDIFFKMAECLGLSQVPAGGNGHGSHPGYGKDNAGKAKECPEGNYEHYSESSPRYGGKDGYAKPGKRSQMKTFKRRQSYH
ncbi:Alkaline phosphatase H [Fulvia fulva]|uniref:alkaline phosphatase n=1 Tax=Passalora fulva TaxID=5499 RepID=A0A9Q8P5W3_PASFU|nr:Alkaline phosphatase H [Fulvia fulva]KAK4632021.1 Alkaline phosphatase H [Fulvia fulva]UJO14369.1 Alkaline phosphatase H [Fulvia fulva]WPV11710.1 Alkaline phosphatase H [Fulvia fulva]WPV26146.1 Alkaline phosphatase H [Fulvia fulva]